MTSLPIGLVIDALLKIETRDQTIEVEMPITMDRLCTLLVKCGFSQLAAEVRRHEFIAHDETQE